MEIVNDIKKIKLDTSKLNLTNLLPVNKSTQAGNVIVLGKNVDFSTRKLLENTTYCICYKYDLKGNTITLPKGCCLEFRGGSIANGTIIGTYSNIIAHTKVFDNINIEGTWTCVGNAAWWAKGSPVTIKHYIGADGQQHSFISPDNYDDSKNIQQALDSSFRELVFPPMPYYTSKTLTLKKEKKIVLQGSSMGTGLGMLKDTMKNTAIIYTDQDIDLFVINVTENGDSPCMVSIEGGNFDVSRIVRGVSIVPYTHSCIKVICDDYNSRLWGLTINTNIFGSGSTHSSIGINLNPTQAVIKNPYHLSDYGYITQIHIGGTINKFGTGIKAVNQEENGVTYNWCSGLDIDCNILYCKKAVDIFNVDVDIKGLIQSDHIYTSNNEDALIYIDSLYTTAIGANIFDINNKKDTARYAVNIVQNAGVVQAYGRFAALCNGVSESLCRGYTNRLYK